MYAVCCMYYAVCCMLTLWLVPYGVVCFLCSDDACFSNSISSQPILLRFVLIKDRLCSQFTNDMVVWILIEVLTKQKSLLSSTVV